VAALGVSRSAPKLPARPDTKYTMANRADPMYRSRTEPTMYSTYMLEAMCRMPKCRNDDDTSRHHSPAATSGASSHSFWASGVRDALLQPMPPPILLVTRKMATLTAIRARVTHGSLGSLKPACGVRVRRPAHSGQRRPTGVWVTHSGQMGRPQLAHARPVSRAGWR
jgi:hypothetical protein